MVYIYMYTYVRLSPGVDHPYIQYITGHWKGTYHDYPVDVKCEFLVLRFMCVKCVSMWCIPDKVEQ